MPSPLPARAFFRATESLALARVVRRGEQKIAQKSLERSVGKSAVAGSLMRPKIVELRACGHRLARACVVFFCILGGALPTLAQSQAMPAAVSGSAERDDGLRALVDEIVQPAVAERKIPGLIVAISRHGQRRYFSYGDRDREVLQRDTIVEIGSITKVFTTALFAQALTGGHIAPNVSIQAYLPGITLRPCARQVTPLELADFTSGMPELPDNAPERVADRSIENYTEGDFMAWLEGWSPANDGQCVLPARYRYSNVSVGLLGIILRKAFGMPWPSLVTQRITGPLGMVDTAITVAPENAARRAQGHGPLGRAVMPWPMYAWYAAGALRSTAQDMLTFGEAALGHASVNGASVPPALTRALQRTMTPIYQPEGKRFAQAMAWAVEPGQGGSGIPAVTYKDGGTNGFNSVIVIVPATDTAVFIVANKARTRIPELGLALARGIR